VGSSIWDGSRWFNRVFVQPTLNAKRKTADRPIEDENDGKDEYEDREPVTFKST